MGKIESPKAYTGSELENVFFKPMLVGKGAEELGIKIMYNMPVPTTLQFWKKGGDVLQKFTKGGWSGGAPATKYKKQVELERVKAEVGYGAADYYNMVYEVMTNRADFNMQDLSGTELEEAETALFKQAIAESIRATMWLGDKDRAGEFNTFDGIIKKIMVDSLMGNEVFENFKIVNELLDPDGAETILKRVWDTAPRELKELKSDGGLVYFVTSDIYAKYEDELDSVSLESAYIAKQEGRPSLSYRGIPVEDMQISGYLKELSGYGESYVFLTDRRNFALAVNTNDFPGTEVKMWFNPDEMENRQRAVFMAGCDYLVPNLICYATK